MKRNSEIFYLSKLKVNIVAGMHNRYMTILDTALLEEIRNGNLKPFELVFKDYYSRLCKYAYSMVKDYEVSSDLVKDTREKSYQYRTDGRASSSASLSSVS